jgi:hypothetical protein
MVEGKGFVYLNALSIRYFVAVTLQNVANCCVTCARAPTADPDFQLQAWLRDPRRNFLGNSWVKSGWSPVASGAAPGNAEARRFLIGP